MDLSVFWQCSLYALWETACFGWNDNKGMPNKGDKVTDNDGYQYITFKRKRYKVVEYYKGKMRCIKLEEVNRKG